MSQKENPLGKPVDDDLCRFERRKQKDKSIGRFLSVVKLDLFQLLTFQTRFRSAHSDIPVAPVIYYSYRRVCQSLKREREPFAWRRSCLGVVATGIPSTRNFLATFLTTWRVFMHLIFRHFSSITADEPTPTNESVDNEMTDDVSIGNRRRFSYRISKKPTAIATGTVLCWKR